VDRRRLKAQQARSKFTPARVNADDVDFSDRFSLQAGSYRTFNRRAKRSDLYDDPAELANFSEDDEDESIDEKLTRLRREVEQLKSTMAQKSSETPKVAQDENISAEIEKLSETLDAAYVQRTGTRGAEAQLSHTLQTFKSQIGSSTSKPIPTASTFLASDSNTAAALAKAADIDTRLAFIEAALGLGSSQLPEASDEDHASILPTLATLERVMQIATAQPSALEAAQAKSRNLIKDVERAQRLKQELETSSATGASTPINGDGAKARNAENSDQTAKINALYGILPTVESLAPTLPLVLERLRTLRLLHSSAAGAQSLLEDVEKRQHEQAEELKTWNEALEKVEANLKDGEAALTENTEKMGGWIRDLEMRLAK
jgi:nuclear migration protein JNM1